MLIVPPYHPWAKRKDVSISELVKEPFIFREAGSGTRQMIEKFLARHGITPHDMKISTVLGSTEAIKDAVENGLGVSIISRWAARKESKYGTLTPSQDQRRKDGEGFFSHCKQKFRLIKFP